MSLRMIARWIGFSALALVALSAGAQQRPPAATPAPTATAPALPPLFFREEWRQLVRPADAAPDFVPEGGVTAAAVTNSAL